MAQEQISVTHFFTITKQDTPLHLLKPAAIRAVLARARRKAAQQLEAQARHD